MKVEQGIVRINEVVEKRPYDSDQNFTITYTPHEETGVFYDGYFSSSLHEDSEISDSAVRLFAVQTLRTKGIKHLTVMLDEVKVVSVADKLEERLETVRSFFEDVVTKNLDQNVDVIWVTDTQPPADHKSLIALVH